MKNRGPARASEVGTAGTPSPRRRRRPRDRGRASSQRARNWLRRSRLSRPAPFVDDRPENPFPDFICLLVAPGGMIRDVQPHLQGVAGKNALPVNGRPKERSRPAGDPHDDMHGIPTLCNREPKGIEDQRIEALDVHVLKGAVHVANAQGLRGRKEAKADTRAGGHGGPAVSGLRWMRGAVRVVFPQGLPELALPLSRDEPAHSDFLLRARVGGLPSAKEFLHSHETQGSDLVEPPLFVEMPHQPVRTRCRDTSDLGEFRCARHHRSRSIEQWRWQSRRQEDLEHPLVEIREQVERLV